jgi:hypothetical protein
MALRAGPSATVITGLPPSHPTAADVILLSC